jgi:hypothetical protein
MPKPRKYDYLWIVQTRTCQGWEDVHAATLLREAGSVARDYRTNAPEPVRVISRRVLASPAA